MEAPAAEATEEELVWDLSAMPAGVLQNIFTWASTWQSPGCCRVAPVCRSWRAAAAGCRDIRLLLGNRRGAALSFATWVKANGQQLQSLVINMAGTVVLDALAAADAAAISAGRPLPLHTLRVLDWHPHPARIGALLAALPNLQCLQAGIDYTLAFHDDSTSFGLVVEEGLAPLRQATQLQELYWSESWVPEGSSESFDNLLPSGLKRLVWASDRDAMYVPDVSPLTHLTFLQLAGGACEFLRPRHLPPSLQLLELVGDDVPRFVIAEQQQVLSRLGAVQLGALVRNEGEDDEPWEEPDPAPAIVGGLSKLWALAVDLGDLHHWHKVPAMPQRSQLTALVLRDRGAFYPVLGSAVPEPVRMLPSMSQFAVSLRRLDLDRCGCVMLPSLSLFTQLTWLRYSEAPNSSQWPPHSVVTQQLSRLPHLKWLSVPGALLNGGHGWLGDLQQLRVLVLVGVYGSTRQVSGMDAEREMPWLAADNPLLLPPCLLILGCDGLVRRHTKRLVAGSGCEVVDSGELEKACDPTQQLAGLPEALQQALG
jgi:hypothetical protein